MIINNYLIHLNISLKISLITLTQIALPICLFN